MKPNRPYLQPPYTVQEHSAMTRTALCLKRLNTYTKQKKTSLGDAVLIELAETVYSLCRYMGRPAFIKRGKAILSDMLSLRTRDGTLQTRVREIMLRFIELEN